MIKKQHNESQVVNDYNVWIGLCVSKLSFPFAKNGLHMMI